MQTLCVNVLLMFFVQVVLNCRFIYACLLAMLNAAAFVLWARCMATPFLSLH